MNNGVGDSHNYAPNHKTEMSKTLNYIALIKQEILSSDVTVNNTATVQLQHKTFRNSFHVSPFSLINSFANVLQDDDSKDAPQFSPAVTSGYYATLQIIQFLVRFAFYFIFVLRLITFRYVIHLKHKSIVISKPA